MKLTLMRDNNGTSTMRTLDINLQIEAMKHETKARPISNLRTSIRYASPDSKLEAAQKLPKVIPAANFRKTTNGAQMTGYNGIVQIEVNHLANRTDMLFSPLTFLVAFCFCLLLNLLSAGIPAWRVSRMNIVDAINQR